MTQLTRICWLLMASLSVLLLSGVTQAKEQISSNSSTPEGVVKKLYKEPTPFSTTDKDIVFRHFDPSLGQLLIDDYAGMNPMLHFDPLCDGQDCRIEDFRLWESEIEKDKAIVTATFKNFQHPTIIDFKLRRIDGKWRITNLISRTGSWNLLSLLGGSETLEEEMEPSSTVTSPFSKHEERYQRLFASLEAKGMTPDELSAIFTSDRAQERDMTPVERMSKKVISPASMRTKKQIRRIAQKTRKHLNRHKSSYDMLEVRFGVNREIAAAILFKETSLGEFKNWKHESFTVLNSMLGFMELPADADHRQSVRMERILSTAERSLAGLLLHCHKYHIDITQKRFPSSFAGAVGIPQFMPMHMNYVITDGKTTPDLSRMSDAILSLGNLMTHKFDWPGPMKMGRLKEIDTIVKKYVDYDTQNKGVSFCMSADLENQPLRRFVDEFGRIPHIGYIAEYAAVLMQYNYSSNYVLDVLRIAFHAHR